MALFVSYARQDHALIESLRADLERLGRDVWIDYKLRGGQDWWNQILEQIRTCDVFVWTVSPSSIASKACRTELEYAAQLGRPILPVMVKDVNLQLAPHRIANAQVVDYSARTSAQAFQLAGDLAAIPSANGLPDPLPEPPPVPITYLDEFADELASPAPMSPERQRQTIGVLRPIATDRADAEGAATAVALLHRLRMRPEITFEAARTIDEILAQYDAHRATGEQQPPPPPPPTDDGHEEGWQRPDATPSDDSRPFSTAAFVLLLLASIPVGLVGIVAGALHLRVPAKRGQARVLLGVGIVTTLLAAGLTVMLLTGASDKEPFTRGDDDHLDTLWNSCDDGDGGACDDLLNESPVDSEYATFGGTCGDRIPSGYECATIADADEYGDHAYLDDLWDACNAADRQACTDLEAVSADETTYAAFATVCGALIDTGAAGGCEDVIAAENIGDNAFLDDLVDQCDQGDSAACDDLFNVTQEGSQYETFAQTCGDLVDEGVVGCLSLADAFTYGDHPYLDGLADDCQVGDGTACNRLYTTSSAGTDYEAYGSTCGYRTDPTSGTCPDVLTE